MANIGTVYHNFYKQDKKDVKFIQLDIRTISLRKKFTISVNKLKYKDGILKRDNIIQGKEDHPDYHIWANFANRGESRPSVIVGSMKNMIAESGLAYKSANIFDPFLSKHSIYFSLFSVNEDEKKKDPNLLYNVVASPYKPSENSNTNSNYQAPQANPSYDNTPQETHTTTAGNQIPVTNEDISDNQDDEIPF